MTRYLFHIADPGIADPTLSGVEIEHSVFDGKTFTGTPVRTDIQCTDFGTTTGFCGYLTSSGTSVNLFGAPDAHPSGHVLWYGAKPSGATDHSGGSCPSGTTTECVSEKSTPASSWVSNGYHYTYTTTSSANMPANVNRSTHTVWAPSGWLLDLVSERWVYDGSEPTPPQSDGSTVVHEWHENNTATGVLNGTLTWDSPSHALLLTCRYPDGAGAAAHSVSLSDTEFTSPPSAPCAAFLPSWPPTLNVTSLGTNSDYFGHDYSSQNAQLTNAQWVTGASGSVQDLPWSAFHAARDTNTGLITSSTDSSAHTTSYVYDGLGRLTSLTPPSEEATTISYDSTTQTTVTRTGTDGNTWERYQYDGLGRLIREKRQLGGTNAFSVRAHSYDAAGHEYYTSEWKPCTSDADCQSKTFTPAAVRMAATEPSGQRDAYDPPGSPHEDDQGRWLVRHGRPNGWFDSLFRHRRDGYDLQQWRDCRCGALHHETRRAGPGDVRRRPTVGSGADTTTYTYNVLDKLSGVTQGVQTRSFGYNAFGFLKSETNPENGTTSYTYGSQGDVQTKAVGGKSYSFTYDPAVRQKGRALGSNDVPLLHLRRVLFDVHDGAVREAHEQHRLQPAACDRADGDTVVHLHGSRRPGCRHGRRRSTRRSRAARRSRSLDVQHARPRLGLHAPVPDGAFDRRFDLHLFERLSGRPVRLWGIRSFRTFLTSRRPRGKLAFWAELEPSPFPRIRRRTFRARPTSR